MYFCTVNINSRIMLCTLRSANWQQASKLSVLWRFELIWKYWDKCAHQYSNYHYNCCMNLKAWTKTTCITQELMPRPPEMPYLKFSGLFSSDERGSLALLNWTVCRFWAVNNDANSPKLTTESPRRQVMVIRKVHFWELYCTWEYM